MTTRRAFLTQAGILGAGLVLAPGLVSAKGKPKAGFQLYAFRDELPKDVKGVIAKVAAAGYNEVETYGYTKQAGFWGLSPADFKALLKKHGLSTPSGHYNMDELIIGGSLTEVDNAIEAAKILGQEYVILPWVNPEQRMTAADLKNIVNKVNLAAERISKAGLKMAYHNHDFEFKPIEGIILMDMLMKETDPTRVHFEMDLYWVSKVGQDPVHWFKKYPGRYALLHVKDMDKKNPELNTELGKGSIDFKSIFKEVKVAGVQHFIVEQENFAMDPAKSITESCSYLRNVLLK